MSTLVLYMLCFIVSGAGAFAIIVYGSCWGLVDVPKQRSSHVKTTPKGGGIGILAAFILCCIWIGIDWGLCIPACFLSLVSLYGDRLHISPKIRLMLQFLCTFVFLISFFSLEKYIIFLIIPLSIFIVGTVNFYNFMDGIDGIAGITGVVGFILIAFYTSIYAVDKLHIFVLSISMAGACSGFLIFNMPKAKVFMGDTGSILLGFLFAAAVIELSESLLDFITLCTILITFYADELTTMAVRLKKGEKLFKAHRRHLYQIFANECALAHWKVSAGFGIFQAIAGTSALILKPKGVFAVLGLALFYFISFAILSYIVRKKVG